MPVMVCPEESIAGPRRRAAGGAALTVICGSGLLKSAALVTFFSWDLSSWKSQRKGSPALAFGSMGLTDVSVNVDARHAVEIFCVVSELLTKPAGDCVLLLMTPL